MSICDHGSETFAWVCRCSNGLPSAPSPAIHIFAGEKVCIQVITPMQVPDVVASWHAARMASAVVRTGLGTIRTGIDPESSRTRQMSPD